MGWARLSDDFWGHPKLARVSDAAFRAWVCALAWSAAYETDGRVTASDFRVIRPRITRKSLAKLTAELVDAGLLDPVTDSPDAWDIHDFLAFNPSRAELEVGRTRRSLAAKKAANERWTYANNEPNRGKQSMRQRMRDRMHASDADDVSDRIDTVDAAELRGRTAGEDAAELRGRTAPSPYRSQPIVTNKDPSLRSGSLLARDARDDALQFPFDECAGAEGASDDVPLEVREVRDLVLAALPPKYQADPLTWDEAEALARDYPGAHVRVGEAIAECRRRGKLPFPRRVREIMLEVKHGPTGERPVTDDPIWREWERLGVIKYD